uniref:nuclear receptor coactivator 5-like n=1 Tax=Myxine glutinosa TaxID=7769 RepID=UPI00359021EA
MTFTKSFPIIIFTIINLSLTLVLKRAKKESASANMSRKRSRSRSLDRNQDQIHDLMSDERRTNSFEPQDVERRIFVGCLPVNMEKKEMEDVFNRYGKIYALSLYKGFGFVQYESSENAKRAAKTENGRMYRGKKLDVKMALVKKKGKLPSASVSQPPSLMPRDPYPSERIYEHDHRIAPTWANPYDPHDGRHLREYPEARSYRDDREMRDMRPMRDARDSEDGRALLPQMIDRYGDVQRKESVFDGYMRYEEYIRHKEDPLQDRYREPHEGDVWRWENARRKELYKEYYKEFQRKLEAVRPVDCVIVVVNKQLTRFAESVGRRFQELGLSVDLIFLNSEVSLKQAMDDVTRGKSPFAIVLTAQHEVFRSCNVSILHGAAQAEHRNMPMDDALSLVSVSFENLMAGVRDEERTTASRQAASMAETMLERERERSRAYEETLRAPPPVRALLFLLVDGKHLTVEEIDCVADYLNLRKDKLLGHSLNTGVPNNVPALSSSASLLPSPAAVAPSSAEAAFASHTSASAPKNSATNLVPPTASTPPQAELQSKILSLFAGSANMAAQARASPAANMAQSNTNTMSRMQPLMPAGQPSASNPNAGSRMKLSQQSIQGPTGAYPSSAIGRAIQAGGNVQPPGLGFNSPHVQKALDTLIQSTPALSQLVNTTTASNYNAAQSSAGARMVSYPYPRY